MFAQAAQSMRLLAEDSPPDNSLWLWALFVVGAAVVIFFLRRQAKRAGKSNAPAPRASAATEDLHRSMDRLLVELQETSREINATLDTKMIVLNKLIQDADRRIEELKALQKPSPAAPVAAPRPEPTPEAPLSEEARKRSEREREICRLADAGQTELEIARRTGTPRGEVELVLRLRPASGTGDTPR